MCRPRAGTAGLVLALLTATAAASDRVAGERRTFVSPNGITESCVALDKMPDGIYTTRDEAKEKALCDIDIYDPNVAICPKLRSTSPGTFVYQIDQGPYAGNQKGFESKICPKGKVVVSEADGPPVSFKVTMNAENTSATFSTASLLYYHFSATSTPPSMYPSASTAVSTARFTSSGSPGAA